MTFYPLFYKIRANNVEEYPSLLKTKRGKRGFDMKKCPGCKAKNQDTAAFCKNCGSSLNGVPITSDDAVVNEAEPDGIGG